MAAPRRRSLVTGLALSCLAVMLASCADRGQALGSGSANDHAETTIVPVAKAIRRNLSNSITLTGEFIPYQEVDLMAKVAGYVRSIKVDIGDRVRQGEVLAELEVPEMQDDLAKAAASVEAAEANVVTARDNANRAKSAHEMTHLSYTRIEDVSKHEPGLVPQQEVDEVRSKDLVAEAEMSAAQSAFEAAERNANVAKAEQARAATLQRYTIITAPFNGVVTKRYANTGAMVQAGTTSQTQAMPVIRLSQNDLLRLMLPVPESAVPGIHIGSPVDVSVGALGRTFPGRVTRFADEVKMSTRTMDTEVDVPNPKLTLVPGMYAEIRLQLKESINAVSVPVNAVEENASGATQIYAVRNSKIEILPVVTGIKTATEQEIRSGLREGDMVIVGRHAGLQNGESVEPKFVDRGDASVKAQGN